MRTTLAAIAGLALIGLVQLPAAGPAAAATCGPYPVPCAPSSSEQAADFFSLLRNALFSGSA
ncbi:hypothetical protein [Nocardia neocaledoniensis]|uniref:hypothetical protein n=1 Tax=Nocardia neocaledoniensis TaxID=236511 RepID=UPI0024571D6A|nr:hypothetical protein [Nocardia neocaledoniensis]